MPDPVDVLVLDLLEWIGPDGKPYREVMEAWRTSCPRLTVWEDAVDRGLVARKCVEGQGTRVEVTEAGQRFLREHQRLPQSA